MSDSKILVINGKKIYPFRVHLEATIGAGDVYNALELARDYARELQIEQIHLTVNDMTVIINPWQTREQVIANYEYLKEVSKRESR